MDKFTIPVKCGTPVKTLHASMGVRYWEDGKINGVEDDDDNPKGPSDNPDKKKKKSKGLFGKSKKLWDAAMTAAEGALKPDFA